LGLFYAPRTPRAMIRSDYGLCFVQHGSKHEFHGELNDARVAGVQAVVSTDIALNLSEGRGTQRIRSRTARRSGRGRIQVIGKIERFEAHLKGLSFPNRERTRTTGVNNRKKIRFSCDWVLLLGLWVRIPILEMLVKVLMFLMLAIVTIGGGFAVGGL
jgi:hypothetical protein